MSAVKKPRCVKLTYAAILAGFVAYGCAKALARRRRQLLAPHDAVRLSWRERDDWDGIKAGLGDLRACDEEAEL